MDGGRGAVGPQIAENTKSQVPMRLTSPAVSASSDSCFSPSASETWFQTTAKQLEYGPAVNGQAATRGFQQLTADPHGKKSIANLTQLQHCRALGKKAAGATKRKIAEQARGHVPARKTARRRGNLSACSRVLQGECRTPATL